MNDIVLRQLSPDDLEPELVRLARPIGRRWEVAARSPCGEAIVTAAAGRVPASAGETQGSRAAAREADLFAEAVPLAGSQACDRYPIALGRGR